MLVVTFIVFCFEIFVVLITPDRPYVAQLCMFVWGLWFIEEMQRTIAKQKEQNV